MPSRVLPTGVTLHWREAGRADGPPVIWIHGGSVEDSSLMLPDLEPFLGEIRALLPDTRGHGLSSRFERPEEYTYARKAADLAAWIDALGVERAVWGGASMGAALSLWMAVHHPARVRAVVSISGPPYAPVESDVRWWAAHRALVAAGRFDEFYDANVRLRLGEAALQRLRARPERWAALVEPLRRHTTASLLALLDETYTRTDWLGDCARIRCPVLVVSGSEDHFPTVEMSRRVAATIPGARLHVVAGGSHFPNRSHRGEVQAVVRSFLEDTGVIAPGAPASKGPAEED
jgi:pimeloyl-ACP methyl ester carboxylesterase